jgi:hypothetical protein
LYELYRSVYLHAKQMTDDARREEFRARIRKLDDSGQKAALLAWEDVQSGSAMREPSHLCPELGFSACPTHRRAVFPEAAGALQPSRTPGRVGNGD